MTELAISLAIAILGLLVAAAWMMHRTDKDLALLQTALRHTKAALEHEIDAGTEMFRKWSEEKRTYEERALKAAARYHAGTMKYEEVVSAANARWIEAARQNANLTEQLASIRLKHPEAYSENEEHIEDVSPSIPYSMELADWLAGLESANARELAIEYIEEHRKYGIDDEQIIEKLEEEWTA
jgi:predicted exporter